MRSRVVVALSGGVDSAVAAARLVDDGHDVVAIHCRLADVADADQVPGHGCCTLDDAQDARRTAQVLDVPFYVWDLRDAFVATVQRPFVAAYAAGATPNPCITCNERVKYAALLDRARRLGFDGLATGHHVRLRRGDRPARDVGDGGPAPRLLRATDRRKDQTYVLHVATAAQLRRSLFPVGESTKSDVRVEAAERGLRVAAKPDSHDICFVPDGDTAGYLGRHLAPAPGAIVDGDGTTLGRHEGTWRFTVGQRRGLGLGARERRFVTDLDPDTRRVTVGPRAALACWWVDVQAPTWIGGAPTGPVRVQVRAHGASVPGRVRPHGAGVRVEVDEALVGVAVGQSVVCYSADDEECLGGGRIVRADRAGAQGRVTSEA